MNIKFPDNKSYDFELGTPIVILGANGSGKTRFSIELEKNNSKLTKSDNSNGKILVHRISAQKNLNINPSIRINDLDSSRNSVVYGNELGDADKFFRKYNNKPATWLANDYDGILSFLFAQSHKELYDNHERDKKLFHEKRERYPIITTVTETAASIWNDLMPHRRIDFSSSKVNAYYKEANYSGEEMSDGERMVLYIICQVILLEKNSILIIDEPELHIHKAILYRLWDKLESYRPDCIFIYITHDLDFASSRNTDKSIWIKSFDGKSWEYEFLEINKYSDIPQSLFYEIVGTRQNIIFVEGTSDSYDFMLYKEFFHDQNYHIIPCGSCKNVIKYTRSKDIYSKFTTINVYGLIDRDFRTENEINKLMKDGIFCLNVAEVENLFVVPDLLDIMEIQLGCNKGSAQSAKNFIQELFSKRKESQIQESFIQEINHKLSTYKISDKKATIPEIKSFFDVNFSEEKIKDILSEKQTLFDQTKEVDDILKIFNHKGLSKSIGSQFEITGKNYPQRVINIIKENKNDIKKDIFSVLSKYIPNIEEESKSISEFLNNSNNPPKTENINDEAIYQSEKRDNRISQNDGSFTVDWS